MSLWHKNNNPTEYEYIQVERIDEYVFQMIFKDLVFFLFINTLIISSVTT